MKKNIAKKICLTSLIFLCALTSYASDQNINISVPADSAPVKVTIIKTLWEPLSAFITCNYTVDEVPGKTFTAGYLNNDDHFFTVPAGKTYHAHMETGCIYSVVAHKQLFGEPANSTTLDAFNTTYTCTKYNKFLNGNCAIK